MIAGVPKEVGKGEKRVALVPESIARLKGLGIVIERGAGEGAGFPDSAYAESGASTASDAKTLYQQAEIILKVQPPTEGEVGLFREGSTIISFLYPLSNIPAVKALASRGVTAFAMDLMPRISRAQSMDALSSQATVAGYKAVMLAADALPKLFPLLMTAAGTIAPARVFVLGAGVAAYDVRPAVKEQVESIGARFVEVPLEVKDAQTAGGYAKAQSDEFYRRQQELLAEHTGASDVVITTALVPGKRAPLLISEDSVKRMRAGSVIVDLAAEQGGNCALTEPGKSVVKYGVTILGPTNVPSSMAPEASQLYSRNITTFLSNMLKDGNLNLDMNDELVRGPMVVHEGKVVHDQTRAAMEGASAA